MTVRALPPVTAVVVRVCLVAAVLALATFCYVLWFSALPQAQAQARLYGQLRAELSELSDTTAPLGGQIRAGDPVALIEAPDIGLRQVVVEGTASSQLSAGPGHRRDTPLPGQPGVSVLYGHSTAFGAPFGRLASLRPDETITVTTGQGQFHYRVTDVRRAQDPLPVALRGSAGRLTLVTAEGDGWRTGWAPDHVLYVDADLVDPAQPGLPSRPAAVPTAEKAMQTDPYALIPLVLWLQGLVAAALAVTWARLRWGRRQTWLVGLPVLLACAWGALEAGSFLLPNLL
jgi:sortase A